MFYQKIKIGLDHRNFISNASKVFTDCVYDAPGKCVEKCTKPKVFSTCGSACPPTCDNPNPICTLQCVKGCFCPKGTLLNRSGECVKNCPGSGSTPSCPSPKIYNKGGSARTPTCANPKPEVCTAVCVEGCFCPEGTLLNGSGECVKNCSSSGSNSSGSASSASSSASSSSSSTSNPSCPNPKIYNKCGSACAPTCAAPKPEACAQVCVEGCFCPEGTLLNSSGECVKNCSSNGDNSSDSSSSASSSASSSSSGGSASNDDSIQKV
ncbi:von Willebrand factor-like [Tetranychus urticae]|uniref:von Willebrand factor-like n=1 Tax=Tetranychus urticae TaxID=32264 RepID=UPI000D64BB87|nr:von Willebrand factor-like [Tetranychus urticae]